MLNRVTYVLHFREKLKEFDGNLKEKKICDSKKFWGVVRLMLLNKVVSNE